jgi:hypothetical protein
MMEAPAQQSVPSSVKSNQSKQNIGLASAAGSARGSLIQSAQGGNQFRLNNELKAHIVSKSLQQAAALKS